MKFYKIFWLILTGISLRNKMVLSAWHMHRSCYYNKRWIKNQKLKTKIKININRLFNGEGWLNYKQIIFGIRKTELGY